LNLWIGLLTVVTVPLLLGWLSKGGAGRDGQWNVAQYGSGMRAAMLICGLFFAGLAGFAYTHPGRTPPGQIMPAVGLFTLFGLGGFYTAALMTRSRLLWNDQEVRGQGQSLAWDDLEEVGFVASAQAYQLRFKNGGKIWLYKAMQGFPELWQHLKILRDGPELEDEEAAT